MDLLERYLVHVTLVLTLAVCAIASVGGTGVIRTSKVTLIAAVRSAPVVLGLRFEERRGCLTLAVLMQFGHEPFGSEFRGNLAELGLEIDENRLYPFLRRLGASDKSIDRILQQGQHHGTD